SVKNSGGLRVGSDLPFLEFNQDITVPSAKRSFTFQRSSMTLLPNAGTGSIVGGAIGTGDYPCWEAFIQAKAYAKDNYIRG
ncbi:hypothetical protein OFL77_27650, partial [Escherichia coli]|uniref:hypothetical protein n=1 Tax=Escherichia coli TaxID=562 RepID=UPI0021E0A24D